MALVTKETEKLWAEGHDLRARDERGREAAKKRAEVGPGHRGVDRRLKCASRGPVMNQKARFARDGVPRWQKPVAMDNLGQGELMGCRGGAGLQCAA